MVRDGIYKGMYVSSAEFPDIRLKIKYVFTNLDCVTAVIVDGDSLARIGDEVFLSFDEIKEEV